MAQRPSPNSQAKIMPRLSAPLSKLRKQWLNSVAELDPQAALAVLRERLQGETDGAVRLGNMAAQSWILRQRLIGLQTVLHGSPVVAKDTPPVPTSDDGAATTGDASSEAQAAPSDTAEAKAPDAEADSWTKLRILAETEVNGMRFFEGTTIQVREEDARKLIQAKSAETIEDSADKAPAKTTRTATKAARKK